MDKKALAAQLNIDEGRRSQLYKDTVGKITGGVGHNFDDRGLSPAVIDLMLDEDMDVAIADLDRALPWWRQMSERRQQALANMCFNLGIKRLLGFNNTLRFMRDGAYPAAAEGMLDSLWARQVGDRAKRLAKMMREG